MNTKKLMWEIIEGDCLDVMSRMEAGSVDAIVTDPPWPGASIEKKMRWEGPELWAAQVRGMERVVGTTGKIILHIGSGVDPRIILGPITLPYVQIGILPYMPPRYRGNRMDEFDVVFHFGAGWLPKGRRLLTQRGTTRVSNAARKNTTGHPCPRASDHVDWILRSWVGPGRTVLDPFVGSGTTGISAVQGDIDFVGIEINPEYCEIARRRIDDATKQGRLF